jgi:hypothetical protein
MLVEEADKLGKSMNTDPNVEESHDEDSSPKKNGKPNGIIKEQKPSTSTSEMERFAEQAQRFKPKGNTLETADVIIPSFIYIKTRFRSKSSIRFCWKVN